ncbi:MAG: cyanophycin synthetase [Bacteroidota bacterium]|nr:cyanophycin synthetase [Bacteroidota bacterium]
MIKELKVMRGPNIWSDNHKLIVLKIDIAESKNIDLDKLCIGLVNIFPPIHKDINEIKTYAAGHPVLLSVARLLALTGTELQTISTSGVSYYHGHLLGESSFYSVFEYKDEEHGVEAAYLAADIINALIYNEETDFIPEGLKLLKDISERNDDGPSTSSIIDEAVSRNIPVKRIADGRYILFGYGKYQRKIEAALTDATSMIGVDIAGNKNLTKELLADAMLPVPRGVVITKEEELEEAVRKIGYPLVTKPLNGHQGKCITTDITKFETLVAGFQTAREYSRKVIVEKHIKGYDYRFLVINYKLVAAAKRSPALVVGDGVSTIDELIRNVNTDPARGKGHGSILTRIEVDEITLNLLKIANRTLDSVLEKGEIQILKDTANLSTGGTAEDVTDEVHPDNVLFAERAARVIGLDICGLDIMAPDVSTSFSENGGSIIEVNAAPGLRMHIAPSSGTPRNVGKAIVDMMFPENKEGRIPIVAITGTNGKTTTSRLMAHLVQQQGFKTGFTTTDGIYIDGKQVVSGDCSGPKSTEVVLHDPCVDFAVLECARGGILRSGLAFDQCDIGIVTNVAADHLGMQDIYTVEDMARVKEVIPRSVKKDGYAILNASIDLVYNMAEHIQCNIALFSRDPKNICISDHCKKGGIAAVQDGENIVIRDGSKEIIIDQVKNIPVTMEGKAGFMIENVLPVALAAYILKFPVDKIKESLRSFEMNEKQAPGRLNIIDVADKKVMVDYAHNPHSIKAFSELMNNIKEYKTGIITGVGDRRDEDIEEVGRLAAEIYDEVVIRVDKDTRGREAESIVNLIKKGISKINQDLKVNVVPDMREALVFALENSKPGGYIILNADSVKDTLKMVNEIKEEFTLS